MEESGGEQRRVEEGTEAPVSLEEAGGRGGLAPVEGDEQGDGCGFLRSGVNKPEGGKTTHFSSGTWGSWEGLAAGWRPSKKPAGLRSCG